MMPAPEHPLTKVVVVANEIDSKWAVRTVAACQSGTETEQSAAWDEMSRVLLPVITRLAQHEQRKIGLNSVADDATTETFVALYKNIHSITDATGLTAWLVRVVRNKLIDIAKKTREKPTDEMWPFESLHPDGHRYDYADLYEAVRQLPLDDRIIVHERFWLDSSYEEIGIVVGMPTGTIKSRLSRLTNETLPKILHQIQLREHFKQ